MHDWYDWAKDIGLPLLTGGGSVVVGAVAIYVARQSHKLAVQVRKDEAGREAAAGKERYRDQLFRTIEPTVSALLDHRADIAAGRVGAADERAGVAKVLGRLNMVDAVANAEDKKMVHAVLSAYEEAAGLKDRAVMTLVLAGLAMGLPRLLEDDQDIAALVLQTEGIVQEAIEDTTPEL